MTPKPVSLNFSRSHLYNPHFLDKVADTIRRYALPFELIAAEFTEYACMESEYSLCQVIDGLHKLGMRVSIDDFGSGYSSLNMLKNMEFDELKLDRGFLGKSSELERGRSIIRSVLELSKKLKLSTVAEGIETREQLEFLRNNGCEVAQGYLFSRPISGEQYDQLLRNNDRSCQP